MLQERMKDFELMQTTGLALEKELKIAKLKAKK